MKILRVRWTPVSRSPRLCVCVWSWLLGISASSPSAADRSTHPAEMVSDKQGEFHKPSRFGPSNRISELAQHKTSKAVWATTPCEKLNWGNQEPIWPLSALALGAGPSARIQYLAQHKRGFSAREEQRRKEEEEEKFSRKTQRPSSKTFQYENIVRLSTPRSRSSSSQQTGPHTPQCDSNCPIWHVDLRLKAAVITPRLLQLSQPKRIHPDFQSNRETAASIVSLSSRTARLSQRLVRLSLPRLRQAGLCCQLGRPEESIWTVSGPAKRATASARVETLATPKRLHDDYVPPREPQWSWRNTKSELVRMKPSPSHNKNTTFP